LKGLSFDTANNQADFESDLKPFMTKYEISNCWWLRVIYCSEAKRTIR